MDPRDALRFNEHPDRLMDELPQKEWGGALREIGVEVARWEEQQTPEQAEWLGRRRRASHIGTSAATQLIVRQLEEQ